MDDVVLYPQKDVWPFVTKVWCSKSFGARELGLHMDCEMDADSLGHFASEIWMMIGVDDEGVFFKPYSKGMSSRIAILMHITGVQTKGGVILKTPDDIMSFFFPMYNKTLEQERERRYDNTE